MPRLPDRVVDCLIDSAGVSRLVYDDKDQTAAVERLVHDACEELLARLPDARRAQPEGEAPPSAAVSKAWDRFERAVGKPEGEAPQAVYQMRNRAKGGPWQETDADRATCLKRMPQWADVYEFRTLYTAPAAQHAESGASARTGSQLTDQWTGAAKALEERAEQAAAVKSWQQRVAESGKRECADLAVDCLMAEVAELRALLKRPMLDEDAALAAQSQGAPAPRDFDIAFDHLHQVVNEIAERLDGDGRSAMARRLQNVAVDADIISRAALAAKAEATQAGGVEKALAAAVDDEYPMPDSPHGSDRLRAIDNRSAMWRGIMAARMVFTPEAPSRDDVLEEAAVACESEFCTCCWSDDEVAAGAHMAATIRGMKSSAAQLDGGQVEGKAHG